MSRADVEVSSFGAHQVTSALSMELLGWGGRRGSVAKECADEVLSGFGQEGLMIRHKGEIVGVASHTLHADYLALDYLATKRSGVGRAAMTAVAETFLASPDHATELKLSALKSARGFYDAIGMRSAGRLYKWNRAEAQAFVDSQRKALVDDEPEDGVFVTPEGDGDEVAKGGAGSGHHGHAGRVGAVGGSSSVAGHIARTTAMKELGITHASRMNQYFKFGMPSKKVGRKRYVKWPEAKEWFDAYDKAGRGKAGVAAANAALEVKNDTPIAKPPPPPPQPPSQLPYQPGLRSQDAAMGAAEQDLAGIAILEGTTPEALERRIYNEVKAITTTEPVSIRAPGDAATAILITGRFKTQFETGKSRGTFDPDYRAEAEQRGLGAPMKLAPEQRPVYGYIQVPGRRNQAVNYGSVEFKLKPDVKSRTTVTMGDSLWNFHQRKQVGAPADDPHKGSWDREAFNLATPKFGSMGYIEAQVHGGVSVSDIASIRIGSKAFNYAKADAPLYPQFRQLVTKANQLGIPLELDRDFP